MDIKNLLKNLKLHETTISMILGAIVIIVTGILVVNYFAARRGETIPPIDIEDAGLPKTHVVEEGEDLWKISEKYYGSGYNWVDIAQENNINNPDQIQKGQTITIPDVPIRLAQTQSPTPSQTQIAQASSPTPTVIEKPLNVGKTAHKVVKGDSLWKISEIYYNSGYNWTDIAKENKIANPGLIEEGQELIIPNLETEISESQNQSDPISGTTYTVVKNDSLWEISIRAYGDGYKWVEIANRNNLANPSIIHPGNVLILPR